MSGVNLGGRQIRKGAADSVRRWVEEAGGTVPDDLAPIVERIAQAGGTPLVVAVLAPGGRPPGIPPLLGETFPPRPPRECSESST
jgi:hypothetical protein